ncbi:organic hydroperoxide resistance protein [Stenotrophomonas chelatiphaga]|uniref:Organic hydroperoxide resistance protein n=1 Tax=Stenotrophomonas chelatiphaga TaxID=517011 RepID=A0A0R0D4J4_9GAMM|nr:organic hydroperoxide resistance protein [Stenotrophomonas chelatiphaga]KRG76443.1 organic hydroperoxide resistance protein [Stenotrophomonas chelatiphaga]
MSVDVKYRAVATATGGREGSARTSDGNLNVRLVTPKELGGAGGDGTNPEQLFAAGYSGCFLSAMKVAASKLGLTVPADAAVTATVGIGPRAAGGFGIAVDLAIDLPGVDQQDATRLVETAHQSCPYSNATRNNIDVTLSVISQQRGESESAAARLA